MVKYSVYEKQIDLTEIALNGFKIVDSLFEKLLFYYIASMCKM